MANKKGKKKGAKKKQDPFQKKDWFELKAPNMFQLRDIGYTPATRSTGGKNVHDTLRHRVVEVSLDDLKPHREDDAFRKFKLRVEDIQGKNCLTNFYGMDMTTDKLRSLVRKWQTTIEATVEVKTTDGYVMRVFCIGFTKRRPNQARKTSYAQKQQVRAIRKRMSEIIKREGAVDLKEFVNKLIPGTIGKSIEQACQGIYPLHNVFLRKVKMLRTPKLDPQKLFELHGGASAAAATGPDTGVEVADEAQEAAPAEE